MPGADTQADVVEQMEARRARLEERLNGRDGALHELDFEDVALSQQALTVIHRAAQAMLSRQGILTPTSGKLDPARAIALFVDKVFWDEHNGDLVMCSNMGDRHVCLPIPGRHWSVHLQGRVQ